MSIIQHDDWTLSERGKKDAERHQKKIEDAIKRNVRDVISEESIITKKRGRRVRVPVKGLKDYRFIYKKGSGSGGIGQGEGKEGDVVHSEPKEGNGEGDKAGNTPGSYDLEVEVDLDYLINVMFEDLGLPWIEEKTTIQQLVPAGYKFESISKHGIYPRIHKKRSMIESIKRTAAYVGELQEETGCDEDTANNALIQAKGDIDKAISLIKENKVVTQDQEIFIEDDDLRFKQIDDEFEPQSNAVVIAMMDVSASMSTEKKYLARAMLFWLTEFLKKTYDNVEIRFIIHTTDARIVDEDDFFRTQESGGTFCWSAIDLATYLVETEYPTNEWNVYCVYCSDGEDWEASKSLKYIEKLLSYKINMFAYTEIVPGGNSISTLRDAIKKNWKFSVTINAGAEFCRNMEEHLMVLYIKSKEHIYSALRYILFEKRKK